MTQLTRKGLLAGGAAGAAALAAAPVAQAHGGGGADELVGSWFATITATDPPLGSFVSLMSAHEGGVFTESRRYYIPETPLGPLLETSGHGDAFAGTFESNIRDLSGAVVFLARGTVAAERITA